MRQLTSFRSDFQTHRSPQKYFQAINKLTHGCFVPRLVKWFNDFGDKDYKFCRQCLFAILLSSSLGKRHGRFCFKK